MFLVWLLVILIGLWGIGVALFFLIVWAIWFLGFLFKLITLPIKILWESFIDKD